MRSIEHAHPVTLPTSRSNGYGRLRAERVDGETAVTLSSATNPLKLLVPRSRGNCAWAFASTFGGGLLAGDQIDLHVEVAAGASLMIGTQASTKIYRSPHGVAAEQSLHATIADGASLLVLPDAVTPFATACYQQQQRFDVAPTGTLVLLDWLTSGRLARGERWAFSRYRSRNDIFLGNHHALGDALLLDNQHEPIDAPHRMGRFDCYATLVAVGPRVRDGAGELLTAISKSRVEQNTPLLVSASSLADGVIVRLLGRSTEQIGTYLREQLTFVWDIAGEDPWLRKF
jgi:urease accessory protein